MKRPKVVEKGLFERAGEAHRCLSPCRLFVKSAMQLPFHFLVLYKQVVHSSVTQCTSASYVFLSPIFIRESFRATS